MWPGPRSNERAPTTHATDRGFDLGHWYAWRECGPLLMIAILPNIRHKPTNYGCNSSTTNSTRRRLKRSAYGCAAEHQALSPTSCRRRLAATDSIPWTIPIARKAPCDVLHCRRRRTGSSSRAPIRGPPAASCHDIRNLVPSNCIVVPDAWRWLVWPCRSSANRAPSESVHTQHRIIVDFLTMT